MLPGAVQLLAEPFDRPNLPGDRRRRCTRFPLGKRECGRCVNQLRLQGTLTSCGFSELCRSRCHVDTQSLSTFIGLQNRCKQLLQLLLLGLPPTPHGIDRLIMRQLELPDGLQMVAELAPCLCERDLPSLLPLRRCCSAL
ncbi:hypothetical protein NB700_001906 [Xanthomonas sacchari]|uniref:Uncharacterized protein n=1 Tax=Xanthomonas sacchari TaxID=56458 RepID=A0ABT3DV14_9XANT|nr:hypothetical protein [Xanthomonas sacchari]